MENECKGCYLEGDCVDGVKPHLSETESCPCLNCIVKIMCRDGCEKWKNYLDLTNNFLNRGKNGK